MDKVWHAIPRPVRSLLDHARPPPPLECRCGRDQRWVWYAPKRKGFAPRWCQPPIPCKACEEQAEADDRARRTRILQKSSGLDARLVHMSWGSVTAELDGRVPRYDGPRQFAEHCHEQRRLGVRMGCRRAAEALYRWTPSVGSLWLQGPTGSGKSSYAHATASRLLVVPDFQLTQAAGRRVYSRPSRTSVLLLTEPEMMRRVKLRSNLDRDPLSRFAKCGVLVWDDFGSEIENKGKGGWPHEKAEALLDYRSRSERLPVLFTSNHHIDDLGDIVSPRLLARVHRMCEGRFYSLVNPDEQTWDRWREWPTSY